MNTTITNLAKAFIGESQARNRYTFYAKIAQKEGFEQIAAVFDLTAAQEKEHAKWLMRMINQLKEQESFDTLEVETEVPTTLGTTVENLKSAIAGENYEHTSMYPEFAEVAEKEGFKDIAARLRSIAVAEKNHEARYQKYVKQLEDGSIFKKTEKVSWVCRNCGYVHEGPAALMVCPSCSHPQAFFEINTL